MMTTHEVIRGFNRDNGYVDSDCMFVKQLRYAKLSDEQIAAVIIAIDQVCQTCFDARNPCCCNRDE